MNCFFERLKNILQLLIHFKKKLDKPNRKPNVLWIDKSSEFYIRSLKSRLQDDIEMYSTHKEGKSTSCKGSFKNVC